MAPLTTYFKDEEDCLGFPIWVAELELIVGSARGSSRPDSIACLALLHKLVATLARAGREEVRAHQRRCEDAVLHVLLKGAPPSVRRLLCAVLSRLYAQGDTLPLYSRVSSLQLFLGTREAQGRETGDAIRLGALEALTALYADHGGLLSIGVQDTVALAARYAGRGLDPGVRRAALRLTAAAVRGVGGGHRHAARTQAEAARLAERAARDTEAGAGVRLAAVGVLRAVAGAGGEALWASGGTGLEATRAASLAALAAEAEPRVRRAWAGLLGDLACAAGSTEAHAAVEALAPKPKARTALAAVLAAAPAACLAVPLAQAVAGGGRAQVGACLQAWGRYLGGAGGGDGQEREADEERVRRSVLLLTALRDACTPGAPPEPGPFPGAPDLGAAAASGERPHLQACTLRVLRSAAIERLAEPGRRSLLRRLTALLVGGGGGEGSSGDGGTTQTEAPAPPAPSGLHLVPVAVVLLESVALVIELLGEAGAETLAALSPALLACLGWPAQGARVQAARALAALAVAEPGAAAGLLRGALTEARAARDALAAAGGAVRSEGPDCRLHGAALGCAALLAASTRLAMGLPGELAREVADLAHELALFPRCPAGPAQCCEREAAYIMLGALGTLARPDIMLWAPALDTQAADALVELMAGGGRQSQAQEAAAVAELTWRAAAAEALLPLLLREEDERQGPAPPANGRAPVPAGATFLAPTLGALCREPTLADPLRCRSARVAAAVALLQTRVLGALRRPADLPPSAQEALSTLCLRGLRSVVAAAAAGGGGGGPGSSTLEAAVLAPWLDPFDDVLEDEDSGDAFIGAAGAPQATAWELGLRGAIPCLDVAMEVARPGDGSPRGAAKGRPGGASQTHPGAGDDLGVWYPQPLSLSVALMHAHLRTLGALLSRVSPANQGVLLDALLALAQEPVTKKRPSGSSHRRAAAAAAAAAVLAAAESAGPGPGLASRKLRPRLQALSAAVLEEGVEASVPLCRAAAQVAALASGRGVEALPSLRALCAAAAETGSLRRRAALAVAAGALARRAGGLGLQAGLGAVVGTLCALATASPPPALQTALHALLACAEAAGPAFLPHVLPALELCRDALLRADLYDEPGLLPAAGRLVNAAVASLGPEYALGSRAHDLCKLVVAEAAAAAALGGGTGDDDCSESAVGGVGENSGGSGSMPSTLTTVAAPASPAAALVVVLHTQMLVLFAPGALPAAAHLAVLAGPMASRSAPLRSATLRTLRHLAERDAAAVLAWPGDLPAALVGALDAETRPELAAQAEATLGTLLRAGAAAAPSRWLALAGGVVLEGAEGQGAGGGLDDGRDGRGDGDKERDGDEDGVGAQDDRARREAGRGDGHAPGPDAGVQAGPRPRLGTRLFLADCLAGLPLLAASADARHVDPVAAAGAAGRDWLVQRLEQLVHVGFVEATGQLEALRPPGVALLVVVVRVFAGVRDPLAEGGEPLLGQYEAQLVSAIRTSLAPEAGADLRAAGAALGAAFVCAGLGDRDPVVLRRVLGMLCSALRPARPGPGAARHAEWVGLASRAACVAAHARCACHAAMAATSGVRGEVARAQAPHAALLRTAWTGAAQDWFAARAGTRSGDAPPSRLAAALGEAAVALPAAPPASCTGQLAGSLPAAQDLEAALTAIAAAVLASTGGRGEVASGEQRSDAAASTGLHPGLADLGIMALSAAAAEAGPGQGPHAAGPPDAERRASDVALALRVLIWLVEARAIDPARREEEVLPLLLGVARGAGPRPGQPAAPALEAVRLVARLLCAEGAGQGSEQAQTVLLACLRAVHLHAEAGADPAVSAAAGAVLEALGSCGDPRRLLTAGLAGLRGGAALRRPAALAVARACGLLTTQQGSGSGTVGYSGPESGLPSVSALLDMAVGEVASGTEEVAGQGSDGDSAVALISALLSLGEAASALGAGTRCTEEAASAGALEDRSSPATARCLRALHALASSPAATAAVHQAVTDNLARPGAGRGWALRCGAAVLAPSLDAARAAMLAGPQGMRGASDALAGLRSAARLAVLTANAAAVAGRPDLQPALLGRLLPVLVAAGEAEAGSSSQSLPRAARALATQLAAAPATAAPFSAAVAAAAPELRARLAAALQRGAEAGETPAAGRDEGEGTAAVPRPAIALKSFGGGGLARPPAFSRSAGVKASLGPADNSDEDGWGDD